MMAIAMAWGAMATAGGYLIKAQGYRSLFLFGTGLSLVGVAVFMVYATRRNRLLASRNGMSAVTKED